RTRACTPLRWVRGPLPVGAPSGRARTGRGSPYNARNAFASGGRAMSESTLASYDELPCPRLPFAETHPDNLATVATLFGLRPAPVDRCRVLELGCAGGGNLLPMAEALPDSRFVGLDL